MIDLDVMRAQWAPQDGGLYLAAINLEGAKSSLRRMTIFAGLELAAWTACLLYLGNYVHANLGWNRFAVSGCLLDLYSIAMLGSLVKQIILARSIDYSQPPVAIQARLVELRLLRIRRTRWGVLAGIAVWTPFVVVLLGPLANRAEIQPWLLANLGFSIAVVALVIAITKKYGDRFRQSPFLLKLADDLAGRNLNDAAAFAARLSQFGREL